MGMIDLKLPIVMEGAVPLQVEFLGELTEADLLVVPATAIPSSSLSRISTRHRSLARALAGGMTPGEASVLFGFAVKTIYILRNDPAFKNLVTFYTRSEDAVFRSTQEHLADVTHSALELIEERLEDPEARAKITINQALDIVTAGADRTGNGPQSTSVAVNIHANIADRMKDAREKAAAAMRDVTPEVSA